MCVSVCLSELSCLNGVQQKAITGPRVLFVSNQGARVDNLADVVDRLLI